MRAFLIGLIGLAFGLVAQATASPQSLRPADARAPAHPALYSFADVYRLTVGGPYTANAAGQLAFDAPEAPVRVAVAQAQAAEPHFTVAPLPQPDRWLLVVAGLALAGWVAHRRLVHPL